jgi:hypothetical protein
VQLFSSNGDTGTGCGDDNGDGNDGRDGRKPARESATAISGSGVGWRALLDRLPEEKKPSADVAAGSERGWVRLAERVRRRVFGERVFRDTTGYFDGYVYSDVGIAGAHRYVLADGELTSCIR